MMVARDGNRTGKGPASGPRLKILIYSQWASNPWGLNLRYLGWFSAVLRPGLFFRLLRVEVAWWTFQTWCLRREIGGLAKMLQK